MIDGGYGFIGSHVAEKLYKEGHQIIILDNLSTGDPLNFKGKHDFFNLDVNSPKCEKIFQTNKIDAVIHFAEKKYDEGSQNEVNLSGLSNMISLSLKYDVHKFIYASTTEIYGNIGFELINEDVEIKQPITSFGIQKLISEDYCNRINQLHKMEIVCFRMPEVYGPRQHINNGIIIHLLYDIFAGKKISVKKDAPFSCIYISDVVDAIYQSLFTDICGSYNLTSNTLHDCEEIINIVGKRYKIDNVSYFNNQEKISRIYYNNKKLKKKLSWVPIYGLKNGIEITSKWLIKENIKGNEEHGIQMQIKKNNKQKYIHRLQKALPYLVNILIFVILSFVSYYHVTDFSHYFAVCFLIYILFSAIFGMKQAIFTTYFNCLLYAGMILGQGENLLDTVYILQLFLIIAIGLIIGFISQKILSKYKHYKHLCSKYRSELCFYKKRDKIQVRKITSLNSQITENQNFVLNIFDYIKKANNFKSEHIYESVIQMIKDIFPIQNISIYSVDKNTYLRLLAKDCIISSIHIPQSIVANNKSPFAKVIHTYETYMNQLLDPQYPTLIAPIKIHEKVEFIINIYDIPFKPSNALYQIFLSFLRNIISVVLSRSLYCQKLVSGEKYVSETKFMKEKYFTETLKLKHEAYKKYRMNYCALEIEQDNKSIFQMSQILERNLRKIDYWGEMFGKNFILLSNTDNTGAEVVVKRLKSIEVNTRIMLNNF